MTVGTWAIAQWNDALRVIGSVAVGVAILYARLFPIPREGSGIVLVNAAITVLVWWAIYGRLTPFPRIWVAGARDGAADRAADRAADSLSPWLVSAAAIAVLLVVEASGGRVLAQCAGLPHGCGFRSHSGRRIEVVGMD